MPQHEHVELWQKRFGRKFDHLEKERKSLSRSHKEDSKKSQRLQGIKAKLYNKKRYQEKVALQKKIKAHQEKDAKQKEPDHVPDGSIPAYLMDREGVSRTKVLSNMVKQKKKEKAGKWAVPISKIKALSEDQMFKVFRTGKKRNKAWKRVVNKVTFVSQDFTRKPPKYERFIRPTGLRMRKANVTHPDLKLTSQLDIVGVKHNPQSSHFTTLGVMTKGTIIEVDVSPLGLVTTSGKVVWAKYAQVMNNPELDGTVNAVLLV
eukprot:GHVH01006644.1.p1 GENE.GHVH01006644.1~~GHVH01006644.1.p1  ORF type:complete len:261 (+),score=42.95 GHVH01006644.1:81-863(+)